ncbi:MAG TPA: hypothetical protein VF484_03385 [Candidatus Limnocylindrales bacterium]
MQQTIQRHDRTAPSVVVGLFLIAAGIVVLALREAGVDLAGFGGAESWPIFVIVPGALLLAAAAVPTPPRGIGFAIAGSIVTVVGLLLWYQAHSGDWESWAYLWALIPLAVGLALLGYGSLTHNPKMVTAGLWVGGCAALALVIGSWAFQGVVGEQGGIWSSTWWAVLVIGAGALIVLRGLLGGSSGNSGSQAGQSGEPPR